MKKVYIALCFNCQNIAINLLGVFSSKEQAKQAVQKQKDQFEGLCNSCRKNIKYVVQEATLDENKWINIY